MASGSLMSHKITSTSNKANYYITVNADDFNESTSKKASDWKSTVAQGGGKIGKATICLTETLVKVDGASTSPNDQSEWLARGA